MEYIEKLPGLLACSAGFVTGLTFVGSNEKLNILAAKIIIIMIFGYVVGFVLRIMIKQAVKESQEKKRLEEERKKQEHITMEQEKLKREIVDKRKLKRKFVDGDEFLDDNEYREEVDHFISDTYDVKNLPEIPQKSTIDYKTEEVVDEFTPLELSKAVKTELKK
jgi:large-conductance mechanosensitive channel